MKILHFVIITPKIVILFCLLLEAAFVGRKDMAVTFTRGDSVYELKKSQGADGTGKYYMGREIAQVMGYLGAGWLERPEWEQEEPKTQSCP